MPQRGPGEQCCVPLSCGLGYDEARRCLTASSRTSAGCGARGGGKAELSTSGGACKPGRKALPQGFERGPHACHNRLPLPLPRPRRPQRVGRVPRAAAGAGAVHGAAALRAHGGHHDPRQRVHAAGGWGGGVGGGVGLLRSELMADITTHVSACTPQVGWQGRLVEARLARGAPAARGGRTARRLARRSPRGGVSSCSLPRPPGHV
jgi:hypothetical protein